MKPINRMENKMRNLESRITYYQRYLPRTTLKLFTASSISLLAACASNDGGYDSGYSEGEYSDDDNGSSDSNNTNHPYDESNRENDPDHPEYPTGSNLPETASGSESGYNNTTEIDPDPRSLYNSSDSYGGAEAMNSCPQHWCQENPSGNVQGTITAQVYIIRNSSGEHAIPSSRIDGDRQALNNAFAPMNVSFDTSYFGIQFIDQPEWYDLSAGSEFNDLMNYLGHALDNGGGWSMVYAGSIDGGRYAGVARLCNNEGVVLAGTASAGHTAIHEFGHQLCLAHTHDDYCGAEACDGSNCSTTGDYICDTPADLAQVAECNGYNCDDKVCGGCHPPVENVMSYHFCGSEITPRQYEIMECYLRTLVQ